MQTSLSHILSILSSVKLFSRLFLTTLLAPEAITNMVFSNLFFTGRSLAKGLWRRTSSLCRRTLSGFNWLKKNFADLVKKALKFLSRPEVIGVITFAVALGILFGLGFGVSGIAAGSAAAAFQSVAFGAFTPAGGIFAGLTSMAMTGLYPVFAFVLAGVIAMVMAVIAKIVQRQARA
ncbi:uncharacterized protein EURHEDRAFT_103697 [Aspergillus ruber CBS 135680]|uniref:Uncharacterized protein n=1 Tax=Aspergillus ruber (strain CBS 135680) TaxID=1388766 RepID=A0A017SAB1_ASPRC|nr:uncharacterized protein EURHEDRAFT_103697 [Aspergillus ruber CBS 135680]EYE93988.1 hypothetical protein EURHEDRAFT_103697 [Aspergillus ruber CBS 135680]